MTDQELSPEARKAVDQIQKLLNLAAKNPNENEAAAAASKAQQLLTKYNLDAAVVERASGVADGRREDFKTRGGFYAWQRELWRALAELNFCFYWTQEYGVERTKKIRGETEARTWSKQMQKRHRIVGRMVNTATTKAMATYLEEVIERITREGVGGDHRQFFSRYAMSFREGMVARLTEKIAERFKERLAEDRRNKIAEEAAAREGRPDTGGGKGIALFDYLQSEADANEDFLHGEGYSARQAAERAEWAKKVAEREAAYTAWAQEHPEEAAAKEAELRASRERSARRYRGGPADKPKDWNAYYAGYDAAEKVSIDQQVGTGVAGRIGRSK